MWFSLRKEIFQTISVLMGGWGRARWYLEHYVIITYIQVSQSRTEIEKKPGASKKKNKSDDEEKNVTKKVRMVLENRKNIFRLELRNIA